MFIFSLYADNMYLVFNAIYLKHFGRGEMREFFKDGWQPMQRNEPESEFQHREKAFDDALVRVEDGNLDRVYGRRKTESPTLLKLRKATMGTTVFMLFHCLVKVFILLYCNVCGIKSGMTLRNRKLSLPGSGGTEIVIEADVDQSDDDVIGEVEEEEEGEIGDAAAATQPVAKTPKKKREAKRSLSAVTGALDAFAVPDKGAYTP